MRCAHSANFCKFTLHWYSMSAWSAHWYHSKVPDRKVNIKFHHYVHFRLASDTKWRWRWRTAKREMQKTFRQMNSVLLLLCIGCWNANSGYSIRLKWCIFLQLVLTCTWGKTFHRPKLSNTENIVWKRDSIEKF